MLPVIFFSLRHVERALDTPLLLPFLLLQVWMMVDAFRREEWVWLLFMFVFPGLNPVLYFFLVYLRSPSLSSGGFQLPGAVNKSRIKELEAQIHHLDKAHHYAELGGILLRLGKYSEAEKRYRSALEREPDDLDYKAHLGHCLVRQGKAGEAKPLLETVCAQKPGHDYGYSLMALAETHQLLGEREAAIRAWLQVLESHHYARARVQLGELYIAAGNREAARKELEEVVVEHAHSPAFQARADRVWVKKAKSLLKSLR